MNKSHCQAVWLNYTHLNEYWTEIKLSQILAIFYLRQLQRCSGPTCRLADGEFQKLPHVSSRAVTRTQDQCSVSPQLPITDHSVAAAPLTHPPHTHSTHYNSELLLIREEPEVE